MAALAVVLGVLSLGVLIFRQSAGRPGSGAGGSNPATGPAIEVTATSSGRPTTWGDAFGSTVLAVSSVRAVAPGDCLMWVPGGPGPVVTDKVACSELHRAEVTKIIDLADRYQVWPGNGEIDALAARECPPTRPEHAGIGRSESDLRAASLHAAPEYWGGDTRVLICVVGNQQGTPWSDPAPPAGAAA